MQTARLYDRMGCDLLALDLVRNWEFLKQPPKKEIRENDIPDPRKLMRRRSSLVVADMPSPKSPKSSGAAKLGGFGSPMPNKVFEEPSASSLLDTFGF